MFLGSRGQGRREEQHEQGDSGRAGRAVFLELGLWVHQLCDLSCHFAVSSSETQAFSDCRREMDPGYQGEGLVRIQWEMGQPQTQTQQWHFQAGDGLMENWGDTSWTFRM